MENLALAEDGVSGGPPHGLGANYFRILKHNLCLVDLSLDVTKEMGSPSMLDPSLRQV